MCAASPSCIPRCPSTSAAPSPASAVKEVPEYIRSLGVTSRRAAADPQLHQRQPAAREGAYQLLGLQHDRLLRARRALSHARNGVNEFKEMVAHLHDAGLEVILDVVYNHTAEGNERGADAVVPRHRQRQLLPAAAGPAALLHQRHRHREHVEPLAPARAADGHGQPALLGDRDARRRLPLRPRRPFSAASRTGSTRAAASSIPAARIPCFRRSS